MGSVALIQHSSETSEWGTNPALIHVARKILGRITLDPFSSVAWNTVVRAKRFLSIEDNAFACSWFRGSPPASQILRDLDLLDFAPEKSRNTALVNPPGEKSGGLVKRAWYLTEWHHSNGWLQGGAIWVVFNLNQFQTLQSSHKRKRPSSRSLLHPNFLRCVVRSRLPFQCRPYELGISPSHPTALVLLPGYGDIAVEQREKFTQFMQVYGEIF